MLGDNRAGVGNLNGIKMPNASRCARLCFANGMILE